MWGEFKLLIFNPKRRSSSILSYNHSDENLNNYTVHLSSSKQKKGHKSLLKRNAPMWKRKIHTNYKVIR